MLLFFLSHSLSLLMSLLFFCHGLVRNIELVKDLDRKTKKYEVLPLICFSLYPCDYLFQCCVHQYTCDYLFLCLVLFYEKIVHKLKILENWSPDKRGSLYLVTCFSVLYFCDTCLCFVPVYTCDYLFVFCTCVYL